MSGHPSMIGANGNSMSGPPGQGWQGQPNAGQGPPNMPNPTSMSQGQTLSSSSMNRQSPGVMPGPNSAGENPQMPPGMNPRLQNMGNMPPNIITYIHTNSPANVKYHKSPSRCAWFETFWPTDLFHPAKSPHRILSKLQDNKIKSLL